MISKFCPHCGTKLSSVLLAAKRKLPSLATFTQRESSHARPPVDRNVAPRKSTLHSIKTRPSGDKKSTNQVQPSEAPPMLLSVGSNPDTREHECASPVPLIKEYASHAHLMNSSSPVPSPDDSPIALPDVQEWITHLQKLHAVVITYQPKKPSEKITLPSSMPAPPPALSAAKKLAFERSFATLHNDLHALHLEPSSSSIFTRCLALWTRARQLLDEIPSAPPVAVVDGADVAIKVRGALIHFKSRRTLHHADVSPPHPSGTPTLPSKPPSASTNVDTRDYADDPPRRRWFLHDRPAHLFTRAQVIPGASARVVLTVEEEDPNLKQDDTSNPALAISVYIPETCECRRVVVRVDDLRRMIPAITAPLYLRHEVRRLSFLLLASCWLQLPHNCRHAGTHWVTWFRHVLPCLRWEPDRLVVRYPAAFRGVHVLNYRGMRFFRCLVTIHVLMDFCMQVAAVDVSADATSLCAHVPPALLHLLAPDYVDRVLERFRWPVLCDLVVHQLWVEYTTHGFELLVAGQAPVGRVLVHPCTKMSEREWTRFLADERVQLARVRADCVRLAASVALRKQTQRQEAALRRRIDQRQAAAATTIQRIFRGYIGRMQYHQAVYDHAHAHHSLGHMPGTKPTGVGWFQDPFTLVAYGVYPNAPFLAVRCDRWILTRLDMYRFVLKDMDMHVRRSIAAQCIQTNVRRWRGQRQWHTIYSGVVKLQYEFRSGRRRRYRRDERHWHGLSFGFGRRIRNSWLLLRVRLHPHAAEHTVDVTVSGLHPVTCVAATQTVSAARLVKNGLLDDAWRTWPHAELAARVADATDLFYSAQSQLMTFRIGPRVVGL
ncbi:Aste57867_19421 [Aphanomyces stellatus]|uniref:Aste57867_19421 protein n=1 Tax=Aphanomyces stellatus TaxID=120398 RepID=A0A485LCI4_9STRA|nr:hypothetical protein As57867_019357 [Aphanomyces stellatus]VFT96135.1 Aste57867_19421 [Aphanomyces stellatus]